VKQGRGKRLKETPETFSGLFWSGEQSIKMGLADEIGSVDSVARDVIKAEDIVDFTTHEGIADRLAKKLVRVWRVRFRDSVRSRRCELTLTLRATHPNE